MTIITHSSAASSQHDVVSGKISNCVFIGPQTIAVGGSKGEIAFMHLSKKQNAKIYDWHPSSVRSLQWLWGSRLLSCCANGKLVLSSFLPGSLEADVVQSVETHCGMDMCVDGKRTNVAVCDNGGVSLLALQSMQHIHHFHTPGAQLHFADDSEHHLWIHGGTSLHMVDIRTPLEVMSFKSLCCKDVQFKKGVHVCGGDPTIYTQQSCGGVGVLDVRKGWVTTWGCQQRGKCSKGGLSCHDSTVVSVWGQDMRALQGQNRLFLRKIHGSGGALHSVSLHGEWGGLPDSWLLFTGGKDETVCLWTLDEEGSHFVYELHGYEHGSITGLCVDAQGTLVSHTRHGIEWWELSRIDDAVTRSHESPQDLGSWKRSREMVDGLALDVEWTGKDPWERAQRAAEGKVVETKKDMLEELMAEEKTVELGELDDLLDGVEDVEALRDIIE